ncbi:hypothetical protein PY093_13675 [Cytobacillus sp. S13-E01]|uniref:hypothetical protein n=1 Tax=Cytobacillus sp. S13-E01 TaxID=3031326 RepID=UPI0023D82A3A|nr:hypothetical protein [Cytobacillus sp. S13-E01]MDF0727724.1 hypothetical protein [Cytobacillus sp. S13-E01]
MKKWLLVAGFVGAFAVGSMTGGSVFSYASSNAGMNDTTSYMMGSSQGSGMMNMMGDSNGMGMMNTMSIMDDLMADIFNEVAKTLRMTTDQLKNELQSGKSLAKIAEEQGVKTEKLTKELEKVVQKDIKQFEKDGNVITEQQKEMLLSMSKNMEMMLNTSGMFACNKVLDENN